MGSWLDQELAGCVFADARLGRRFGVLVEQLSKGLGQTLPLACGDWASTKAAYRFLDNGRVSEQEILAGHFQATQMRFALINGPILVLHDTTEFSFTRSDTQAIGQTRKAPTGARTSDGRWRLHTVCGILNPAHPGGADSSSGQAAPSASPETTAGTDPSMPGLSQGSGSGGLGRSLIGEALAEAINQAVQHADSSRQYRVFTKEHDRIAVGHRSECFPRPRSFSPMLVSGS